MRFKDVIGQPKTNNDIRALASSGKVPHALLMAGPEGCGKLAFALALAQYLMCEAPLEDDSCGTCSQCLKVQKLLHPDLHFSFPTVGRNVVSDEFGQAWRSALLESPYLTTMDWLEQINPGKSNAQGNINKEECLNIIRKLSLKSFENERKVLILWMPEYLQKEGNRLLKIIEEPTDHTFFILVAENQDAILNTILSRCQLIKIPPLEDDQIIHALVEGAYSSPDQAKLIAPLVNGNFSEAIKLASQKQSDLPQLLLDWLRKCYQGKGHVMIEVSEALAALTKAQQKHLLLYGLHFVRGILLQKLDCDLPLRIEASPRKAIENMSRILEVYQIEKMINWFTDAHMHLERNANPKVLFLNLSVQMKRMFKHEKDLKRPIHYQTVLEFPIS